MRNLLFNRGRKKRGGYNLVESVLAIGILSVSVLVLAPLLGVGLKAARLARDDRATAQIAQTLVEETRQGTLPSGTFYLDSNGNPCSSSHAAYTVQATSAPLASNAALTQTTLRLTPTGAPDRARTYTIVFPSAN